MLALGSQTPQTSSTGSSDVHLRVLFSRLRKREPGFMHTFKLVQTKRSTYRWCILNFRSQLANVPVMKTR